MAPFIPAKAKTHGAGGSDRPSRSNLRSSARARLETVAQWIPALAGMSGIWLAGLIAAPIPFHG